VLERLSRHGPAPGRARGCGGGDPALRFGGGRDPQHLRHHPSPRRAREGPGSAARQARGTALHLGLRGERGHPLHPRQAPARLPRPLRREEPRLDDRRDPRLGLREGDLPPQRSRASRIALEGAATRPAEADRLRGRLLDGRRFRAGRGDLRSGRPLRGDDLSRRGPRRRALRPQGWRHRRPRRRCRAGDRDPGHARQGDGLHGRLHRGLGGARRCDPQPRRRLHLHHLARRRPWPARRSRACAVLTSEEGVRLRARHQRAGRHAPAARRRRRSR
jgi:hypothetical protein